MRFYLFFSKARLYRNVSCFVLFCSLPSKFQFTSYASVITFNIDSLFQFNSNFIDNWNWLPCRLSFKTTASSNSSTSNRVFLCFLFSSGIRNDVFARDYLLFSFSLICCSVLTSISVTLSFLSRDFFNRTRLFHVSRNKH
jgi:hypothetical protein